MAGKGDRAGGDGGGDSGDNGDDDIGVRPFIHSAALRRARKKKGFSYERLEEVSVVAERTVRRLESGEQPTALRVTILALAKALVVKPRTLVRRRAPALVTAASATPAAVGKTRAPTVKAPRPERTPKRRPTLDELVAAETLAEPIEPKRPDGRRRVGARTLQEIMTAFRGYRTQRFVVEGVVILQSGLKPVEGAAVGSTDGEAARFLVAVDAHCWAPLHVSTHTTDLATTKMLQRCIRERTPVELEVRVLVGTLTRNFKGFRFFDTTKPFPWTLIVVRRLDVASEQGAKRRTGGRRKS